MNNNGYTKIPNAIIRSHNLTVEEKLTWMYIASMPKDYQFTVGEACAVLRINVKTWRRCVANLENAGLVEVDFNPGKKNAYRVLTPSFSDPGSQTAPLPNETPTPPPFETRGTHINKKDLLKNIVVDARARIREEVMSDAMVEKGCMSLGIDRVTYENLAYKVFTDWDFQSLPDSEWNTAHFLAVMRYKVADYKKNNNGQRNDKARRAIEEGAAAIAALASKSGKPADAPF